MDWNPDWGKINTLPNPPSPTFEFLTFFIKLTENCKQNKTVKPYHKESGQSLNQDKSTEHKRAALSQCVLTVEWVTDKICGKIFSRNKYHIMA